MSKRRAGDSDSESSHPVITCATCQRDISNEVYVKCAKCIGFNQCLECHSVGLETGSHFRLHPYMMIEKIPEPVYREDWRTDEEIFLLHGIQVCGLGNWHDIAEIIQTKTALECETHYVETYLKSPIAPLAKDELLPACELPPPLEYDTTPRDSRPSISHDKNMEVKGKKDKTTPGEQSGWMPRRNEFDVEYQNEAEQLIANITFKDPNETQSTFEQKVRFLKVYNEVLEERRERTDFALKWDLIDEDFHGFGGTTRQERELEEAVLPLAQITTREIISRMVGMCERELQNANYFQMLQKWRRNGIVTKDEGLLFNQLEQLIARDHITRADVEDWNRKEMQLVESPEFRATLDRQILGDAENQLCTHLGISPNMYIRLKDMLVREHAVRGEMTREIAESFVPGHEEVMGEVYELLRKMGVFWCSVDEIPVPEAEENETTDI